MSENGDFDIKFVAFRECMYLGEEGGPDGLDISDLCGANESLELLSLRYNVRIKSMIRQRLPEKVAG